MSQWVQYYDGSGQYCSEENAYSKCVCKPWDFNFYTKRIRKKWFSKKTEVVWDFHHHSTMLGGWAGPSGCPPRNDGVDTMKLLLDHAHKIGSDISHWR